MLNIYGSKSINYQLCIFGNANLKFYFICIVMSNLFNIKMNTNIYMYIDIDMFWIVCLGMLI